MPAKSQVVDYGVDVVAKRFLRGNALTWEDSVSDVIAHVCQAASAVRLSIYKNIRPVTNPSQTALRYEWLQPEFFHTKGKLTGDRFKLADIDHSWEELLRAGQPVEVSTPGPDYMFLPDTKSALLVPVIADKQWWGFWLLELDRQEDWQVDQINTLNTIVTIFGAAIMRKRSEEALQQEKESVEAKVTERTKELKEKTRDLEHAQHELQKAAAKTAEQRAQLNSSIQSLSIAFIITNEKKEVQLVNAAVNNILRTHEREWTTKKLADVLGTQVDLALHLDECLRSTVEVELNDIRFKDKYLDIHLAPIKLDDTSGKVIGVVILIRDVTETKIFQQARDEFFAVASHELRTPLTAIRGNAAMALEYFPEIRDNPKAKDLIGDIHTSSQRLIDIVNEYLDISRLETSGSELTTTPFELVSVVSKVMKELEATAREKHLDWELQLSGQERMYVIADPGRTQQVLFNLMGNAIKYTDEGGIYVKVEYYMDKARVIVYDTGRGISQDDQQKIFQKFKQAGDRKYEQGDANSTGMGLYIAKFIAEAMNGRVYIERSIPGVGSGFAFELPMAK